MEHQPQPRTEHEAASEEAETPHPDLPDREGSTAVGIGETHLAESEHYDAEHFEAL